MALALGALLFAAGATARAQSGQCAAWPGEVSPLPTSSSEDPLAARWAQLRAAELSQLAAALQQTNPSAAHRLWRHALCLDPQSDAEQRLAQLSPVSGSLGAPRPPVAPPSTPSPAVAAAPPPAPRPAPARPTPAEPEPAPEPEPVLDLDPVDEGLAGVASALFEARFRDALDAAREARSLLADLGDAPEARTRRARLEVMATTAQLALGREPEATESLRRALAADPDLELDASTPPKVRRLLETVRGVSAGNP